MRLLTRALRYAQAFASVGSFNRHTESLIEQPRLLMKEAFGFCDGFLRPIQIEEELLQLLEQVRRIRPRTVLEIGTSMGGTLYLWTRLSQPDALIISVDLPGGKFGGGYSSLRTPIYRSFARHRQSLHLLRADSHSPATFETLRSLLAGAPLDFLFIDGDHTYEGVRKDWEMYSPLVRNGIIAFHDIAAIYHDTQVKQLWDEVKTAYPHQEYAVHPHGHYGIGVLFKS